MRYPAQYLIICELNRTNKVLGQEISEQLSQQVVLIDIFSISESNHDFSNKTLVVDATRLPELASVNKHLSSLPNRPNCALINMGEQLPVAEMLQWPNLKGCFQVGTSAEDIANGMTAIHNGQNWLNRSIMATLLENYQDRLAIYSPSYHITLTTRELDVLQSLKKGLSNNDIADDLFISENTIKSHLYNIFRKIEVRNRVQAINWAKQYLP